MSPFFRGSVRPARKHPRPWSLNPRLNPDLPEDVRSGTPRFSMLGLPIQETEVTLPVFNGVYPKPSSFDHTTIAEEEKDASMAMNEKTDEGVHVEDIGVASTPAMEPVLAEENETAHVAEAKEVEPQMQTLMDEVTTSQLAETTTALEAPAVAPAPKHLTVPANNWPLPVESPIINDFVKEGADSQPASPVSVEREAAPAPEASTESYVLDVSYGENEALAEQTSTSVPQEATADPVSHAALSGSIPAEFLPTVKEEPAAEHSEEEMTPTAEHAHNVSSQEPDPVAEIPEIRQPVDTETHHEELQSQEVVEKEEEDEDDNDSAEAPSVPRHSPELPAGTVDALPPQMLHDEDDDDDDDDYEDDFETPATGFDHFATAMDEQEEPRYVDEYHPGGATASAEASSIEEPLVSDEQLDVSEEFKPGVRLHAVDPAHES